MDIKHKCVECLHHIVHLRIEVAKRRVEKVIIDAQITALEKEMDDQVDKMVLNGHAQDIK